MMKHVIKTIMQIFMSINLEQKNISEAINDISLAIEKDPNNSGYLNRGYSFTLFQSAAIDYTK